LAPSHAFSFVSLKATSGISPNFFVNSPCISISFDNPFISDLLLIVTALDFAIRLLKLSKRSSNAFSSSTEHCGKRSTVCIVLSLKSDGNFTISCGTVKHLLDALELN
jgi:hypothetical protein